MGRPEFVEESTVGLVEVKTILSFIEKRDGELNYRSNKVKEYLDNFGTELSSAKKEQLKKKLLDLNLVRIKEEHLIKIIDFLPKNANELKVVLIAYPLSLPKKDQDSIIDVVKEFIS